MNKDFTYLKSKGEINSHENNSYDIGYFNSYLDNYLRLKRTIIEKLDNIKDDCLIRYLQAIRIYSYTIYENLWYGYVISNSEFDTINFRINGQVTELAHHNLFKNHLPSFSAAILNFGTCRDFYFVLLRIAINSNFAKDRKELIDTIMINYRTKNKCDFVADIKKITGDSNYLRLANSLLYKNNFRNFYAHRLRLLWWKNPASSDYYFMRDIYNSIEKDDSDIWCKHLQRVFLDAKSYEKEICRAPKKDIISSSEILQKTHNSLAKFINDTFRYIKEKIEKDIK